MPEQPCVSAIMIFLNMERFIEEAIESVLSQTYPHWELLLVDDGSTDGSTAIARRYAERWPGRVRYLEHAGHQNRGMSASRNLGIGHARGEFIAFLDADDVWLPQALERQVALLQAYPDVALVYGPIERWYSWAGGAANGQRDSVEALGVPPDSVIRPPELLIHFLRDEGAKPSGFMVRRAMAQAVGGYEESFRGMYEDQVFCAKVALKEPVFAASECWYRYRKHDASCCSETVQQGRYREARLKFLNWLDRHVARERVVAPALRATLREERWRTERPTLYDLWRRVYPLVRQAKAIALAGQRFIPPSLRQRVWARLRGPAASPPVGWVDLGGLRRLTPISRSWGFDRGLPVDRYYIETFLAQHSSDIKGRVLEIGGATYTRQFGGWRVTHGDVLNVAAGKPGTTIVADLAAAPHIPSGAFDCIIFTQTLPFIYEVRPALQTLARILKPGGVLLLTTPGISKISRSDMERWGHFWSFTTLSIQRLCEEAFGEASIQVQAYGNVLTGAAFLYGLAAQELRPEELNAHDPDYELIIGVRVVKSVRTARVC